MASVFQFRVHLALLMAQHSSVLHLTPSLLLIWVVRLCFIVHVFCAIQGLRVVSCCLIAKQPIDFAFCLNLISKIGARPQASYH
ncbi:hypothetical protein DENSPDRAFT_170639 [Dentipellis sp. KUC8613]|nr:hypothetical protein DENSPDRAFT_170639 [Dentipellis sp. KUC8613]